MPLPRLGIARVRGRSMLPTLRAGDRLVVWYGGRARAGRLVVVRLPAGPDGPRPLAVKRVSGLDPDDPSRWWVQRDNPREGVDSWTVGGISDQDVVALVLARLPRLRRGRLGGNPAEPDHQTKG